MNQCTVCGMAKDDNAAHASEYKGVGAHEFTAATDTEAKSLADDGTSDDIIIYSGGELKSMGDGKFEGYLIRFSDSADTDLVGDYFTKSTEYYIEDGAVIPILYDHGLNATIKGRKIGRGTVKFDDVGLFIKGELDLRDAYVEAIQDKLVKPKKAGLSSGAARHMTERKKIGKGVSEIVRWGIAEASITVAPTEPRCEAMALKSYLDSRVDPFEDETEESIKAVSTTPQTEVQPPANGKSAPDQKSVAGTGQERSTEKAFVLSSIWGKLERPYKGLYEQKLAEKTPSIWETRNVLDEVCRDIASAALTSDISGIDIDIEAKVTEAVGECAAREINLITRQIKEFVEKGGDRDGNRFYLRSLPASSLNGIEGDLATGSLLFEHSTKVASALTEFVPLATSVSDAIKAYAERCEKRIEFRASDPTKSGKVLSAVNVQNLTDIRDSLTPLLEAITASQTKLTGLVELAAPKKSLDDATMLELEMDLALHQTENALAGL